MARHRINREALIPNMELDSTNRVPGLRYATIDSITEEGYVLAWLSGPGDTVSSPARAASFMAGDGRGAYFPFEVGDEVIVGFDEGDLNQPCILGALWSDEDPIPEGTDATETNNTRRIVSREGSELTFNDTSSSPSVLLSTPNGLQILMQDGDKPTDKKLVIKFDENTKIEMSAEGVKILGKKIELN